MQSDWTRALLILVVPKGFKFTTTISAALALDEGQIRTYPTRVFILITRFKKTLEHECAHYEEFQPKIKLLIKNNLS